MSLIEDDAETNPTVPTAQLNYIRSLTDTHKNYTRFLDALLVPRPSHAAFFRDLKGFRTLPTTIKALTLCDPEDATVTKEQRKENYRNVTRKYLTSRFAHPWCRKAMAGMGNTKAGGWWGAEWAATGRTMSKEQQEQEEKLHKLLVPLWISFRSKMFPGDTVVDEWWEKEKLQPQRTPIPSRNSDELTLSESEQKSHIELGMAGSASDIKKDADEDEDDEDDEEMVRQQANSAATGLLRLAAAGMMVNSMSRMQKWKLKRELKKQRF